jgi:hypothetical protein
MARGDNDAQLLEQAPGGRILVAEAAVRALEEIPGFVLKPAEENTPVRDLAWRAEESQTTRAADEQVVARFIELSGRTEYAAAAEAQIAAQPASEPEPWTTTEPERKSRTMLWVGLAAVALIAIAAAFFFLRPKPEVKKVAVVEQPTTSSGTQTSSSDKSTSGTPAGATSQAATNASGEGPAAPLTKAQKRELERQQKKAQQAAVAKPAKESTPQPQTETQPPVQESKQTKVSGNCLYSSDLLPGLIARAENSRGRRQYKEARRMLQAVLACEPGNVKAKEELELVRQDEDTEGSSDPQ